jgi:uncharacterized protein YndB with AHSA1/START domain
MENYIAQAAIQIKSPVHKVWDALVNPAQIKKYMFNSDVNSEWKVGSKITWSGEWNGKPYEDYGVILEIIPQKKLKYSHYSPLTGQPDLPSSYATVTIDISNNKNETTVKLSQDNNQTEEAKQHSEKNWKMMLEELKKLLED